MNENHLTPLRSAQYLATIILAIVVLVFTPNCYAKLNLLVTTDVSPSPHELTPDGRYLVYTSNNGGDGRVSIYSVSTDGENIIKNLTPDNIYPGYFKVSKDSRWVVFTGLVTIPGVLPETGQGKHGIFSVPTDGSSPPVELNKQLAPIDQRNTIDFDFAISDDSKQVVYKHTPLPEELRDKNFPVREDLLFIRSIDGNTLPVQLGMALQDNQALLQETSSLDSLEINFIPNSHNVYAIYSNGSQTVITSNNPASNRLVVFSIASTNIPEVVYSLAYISRTADPGIKFIENGKSILFMDTDSTGLKQLYTEKIESKQRTQLSNFKQQELLAKYIKARGFNCLNSKKRKTLLKNDKIEVPKHSKNI